MNKKEELALKILRNIKYEWQKKFVYFDAVFGGLNEILDKNQLCGTDGENLYISSDYIIRMYYEDALKLKRGILHIYIHCLYLHISNKNINTELWNLASDISAELIIDWILGDDKRYLKKYSKIRETCRNKAERAHFSADAIYDMLKTGKIEESLDDLKKEFIFDDHRLWYQYADQIKEGKIKEKWEKILSYTASGKQGGVKKAGCISGEAEEEISITGKSRYDYRKFLKQFCFSREELELDMDNFDYIFYHYGMMQYGDIPLIEPLEYKEVNRLEELVIAIDTSGSCSREIVQRFLEETYSILCQKENFFKKMQVFLIQCDCCIQDVKVIHSEKEWEDYSREIIISGRGGTDFRPVFQWIEEKRKKKEIKNLKALIYFTDGDGIYPGNSPEYQAAFVFLKKTEHLKILPNWAQKLIVE